MLLSVCFPCHKCDQDILVDFIPVDFNFLCDDCKKKISEKGRNLFDIKNCN